MIRAPLKIKGYRTALSKYSCNFRKWYSRHPGSSACFSFADSLIRLLAVTPPSILSQSIRSKPFRRQSLSALNFYGFNHPIKHCGLLFHKQIRSALTFLYLGGIKNASHEADSSTPFSFIHTPAYNERKGLTIHIHILLPDKRRK